MFAGRLSGWNQFDKGAYYPELGVKATLEGPPGHFISIDCRRGVGALHEKRFYPATPAETG